MTWTTALLILPEHERGTLVSAHVPVVYGCSHACTFCIIPFRRGIETVAPGGRDRRARAQPGAPGRARKSRCSARSWIATARMCPTGRIWRSCCASCTSVAEQEGIERIRFLTSHPNWMTDELLDTVAELPRVMPQIEVPVQAGNDEVLARMRRGYTVEQYRRSGRQHPRAHPRRGDPLRHHRRLPRRDRRRSSRIPTICWPSSSWTRCTWRATARARTRSARAPCPTTCRRRKRSAAIRALEDLQAQVVAEINRRFLGQTVEVLVEDQHKGKWRGRTPQNKLVFFEDDTQDWRGRLAHVEITWTGPWSMQARLSAQEVIAPEAAR